MANFIPKTEFSTHKNLNREFISMVNYIKVSSFRIGIVCDSEWRKLEDLDRIPFQCSFYDPQIHLIKNLGKYKLFLPLKVDVIIDKLKRNINV